MEDTHGGDDARDDKEAKEAKSESQPPEQSMLVATAVASITVEVIASRTDTRQPSQLDQLTIQ